MQSTTTIQHAHRVVQRADCHRRRLSPISPQPCECHGDGDARQQLFISPGTINSMRKSWRMADTSLVVGSWLPSSSDPARVGRSQIGGSAQQTRAHKTFEPPFSPLIPPLCQRLSLASPSKSAKPFSCLLFRSSCSAAPSFILDYRRTRLVAH